METYDLRSAQIALNLGIKAGGSGIIRAYGMSANEQFKESCKVLRHVVAAQGIPEKKLEDEIAKFN